MSNFSYPPPEDAPRLDADANDDQVVLVKATQRFVFDCPAGSESDLLQHLRRLVADASVDFTWFDAAVVSHEVGQRMCRHLEQLHRSRRPA